MLRCRHYLKSQHDFTAKVIAVDDVEEGCRRNVLEIMYASRCRFRSARRSAERFNPSTEPDDIKGIARPRIGFIGGIDAHTFDPPMFLDVAQRLPDLQFILVGWVFPARGMVHVAKRSFAGPASL